MHVHNFRSGTLNVRLNVHIESYGGGWMTNYLSKTKDINLGTFSLIIEYLTLREQQRPGLGLLLLPRRSWESVKMA